MANGTQVGSIYYDLDLDDSKFKAGSASAKGEAKNLSDSLNKIDFASVGEKAGSTFSGIADSIQNVITKFALLATGSSIGLGAILSYAGGLQQTSRSYDILIGDTKTANGLFAQLIQYANTTPFESADITKAGQILLGYGIAAKDVYSTIKVLGDTAASTGADFQSLALVYGQVNASGHLMGQDALQLINNNIPVTSILAKQLGISIQDVRDKMQAGTISSQMFDDALSKMTQAGGSYFNGAAVQADTFNGRLSTLQDSVKQFGLALIGVKTDPQLGFVIQPGGIFDRISQMLPKIGQALTDLTPKFAAGFAWLMDHGKDVIGVVSAILALFLEFKILGVIAPLIGTFMAALSGGAGVLGAIMTTLGGPVVLIGAAIAALIAGLVFLQVKFDIIGKAIDIFRDVLVRFAGPIGIIKHLFQDIEIATKDLFTALTGGDATVGAVGSRWVKFTQDLWPVQMASEAVQRALRDIWQSLQIIMTGDFHHGFLGMQEDEPVIVALLKIHKILVDIGKFISTEFGAIFKDIVAIFEDVARSLQPFINMVIEFVSKHQVAFVTALKVLGAVLGVLLVVAIMPLITAFATFLLWLKATQIVLDFIKDHFQVIKEVVIVLIATALSPLIAILAIGYGAFVLIRDIVEEAIDFVKNFGDIMSSVGDAISNAFGDALAMLSQFGHNIVQWVKDIPNAILKALEALAYMVGFTIRIIVIALAAIPYAIYKLVQAFIRIAPEIGPALAKLWDTIWAWFFRIRSDMHDLIWDAIHDVINFFIALPGNIASTAVALWNATTHLSSQIWHGMVDTVSNMISSIINFFTNLPGQIANFASGLWNAANRTASQIWHGIMDTINQLPGLMDQVLQNIWNKITGWAGRMYDGTKKVADKIWSAFKDGLGIHSPSYLEKAMTAIADNSHDTVSTMADNVNKLAELGRKAVQVTKNPSTTINSGGSTMAFANLAINGDINFANQGDISYFFQKLGRNVELTQQGLTPMR